MKEFQMSVFIRTSPVNNIRIFYCFCLIELYRYIAFCKPCPMQNHLSIPSSQTALRLEKNDGQYFSWNLKGILFLLGKPGFSIAHLLSSELARRRMSVRIIDCAIRFDIFHITDFIERAGAGESILDEIQISRAFTPYQILDSASQILHSDEREITVYLAPFKQFFDGDVKTDEAKFLLHKLLQKLSFLQKKGCSLILAEKEKYSSSVFPDALSLLRSFVSAEWDLRSSSAVLPSFENSLFGDV